jgi:PPP family 3-phenylpropionic acid transporter
VPIASPSAIRSSLPYAAFYGALFLAIGIFVPFGPLWLEDRGLGPEAIGLLLALSSWGRIVTTPAIGHAADRWRHGRLTLVVLAALALLAFASLALLRGFWPLLAPFLLASICLFVLVPLGESRTLTAAADRGLNYGRVRLWGSLAFIAGAIGTGWVVDRTEVSWVLWLLLAALGLTLLAALSLPADAPSTGRKLRPGLRVLLTDRGFFAVVVAASLLQASHALYYGFSALHWQAAGLAESTIGWLWALGVLAEVLLFAVGVAALARFGTLGLLVLAGLGGLVRWSLLALTTAVPLLAAGQVLHALTFGAAHLATVHFIARRAPGGLATTAQAVYAAISGGLVMGGLLLAAGWLYRELAGQAYFAMAAVSLLGLLVAIAFVPRSGDNSTS